MADFGEILRNIGEFGLFQKVTLLALSFPNILIFLQFGSILFIESDPERHCNTDWILAAHPNLSREEQLNLTVPRQEDGTFSRCLMFVPVDWNITSIRELGLNETTGCQDGWVYSSTLYEATIVTDFNLVCGRAHLLQVAQTAMMLGMLSGSLLFGPLAESFGRKRATQTSVMLMLISSTATGLCPNIYLFLVSYLIVGIGYGGYRLNASILATEWIGVSKRSWGVCVIQLIGAVGQCILAGLVYGIRNWRMSQLIGASLYAITAIYIWFIPESARWLLSSGRIDEAKELISKAARINKRNVPEFLLENTPEKESEKSAGKLTLFQEPVLRNYLLITTFGWFSVQLVYASISLNLANFGMNVFMTQLLFGLTEIPAHTLCMWILEALGRKISLLLTIIVGGLSCILMVAIPQGEAVAVTALATLARFFMIWAGSVFNVYIQELFPTSIRQTAIGLSSILSRLGTIVAPSLGLLARYHHVIPPLVYGGLSFISAALCFLLPETRRRELPDSVSEAVSSRKKSARADKKKAGN
ncbi:solute carrier family 22 member 13-like [Nelusetta ayraudi]|uniref:solute carrier family 22 member 13-like n=1 Tax=Nelusetta ayraudi TaxID=303726 RepID=UPI003F6E872B